jgi:hypothetical protein
MNSKGHAMTAALVILATRGAPRAIEFRRHELPELLFFRPLSYLACAMKRSPGANVGRSVFGFPPQGKVLYLFFMSSRFSDSQRRMFLAFPSNS